MKQRVNIAHDCVKDQNRLRELVNTSIFPRDNCVWGLKYEMSYQSMIDSHSNNQTNQTGSIQVNSVQTIDSRMSEQRTVSRLSTDNINARGLSTVPQTSLQGPLVHLLPVTEDWHATEAIDRTQHWWTGVIKSKKATQPNDNSRRKSSVGYQATIQLCTTHSQNRRPPITKLTLTLHTNTVCKSKKMTSDRHQKWRRVITFDGGPSKMTCKNDGANHLSYTSPRSIPISESSAISDLLPTSYIWWLVFGWMKKPKTRTPPKFHQTPPNWARNHPQNTQKSLANFWTPPNSTFFFHPSLKRAQKWPKYHSFTPPALTSQPNRKQTNAKRIYNSSTNSLAGSIPSQNHSFTIQTDPSRAKITISRSYPSSTQFSSKSQATRCKTYLQFNCKNNGALRFPRNSLIRQLERSKVEKMQKMTILAVSTPFQMVGCTKFLYRSSTN